MSLFVNNVEINEVWVNNAEVQTVICNGIEVFNAVQLEYMFDDFERSPNGTLIQNHTMNTGEGWALDTTTQSTIETYRSQQTVYDISGSGPSTAQVDIQPVPLGVLSTSWHTKISFGWSTTNANQAYARIHYGRIGSDQNTQQSYVQLWSDTNGGFELRIQENGTILARTVLPVTGSLVGEMEALWDFDLKTVEGRATINGVDYTVGPVQSVGAGPSTYEIKCLLTVGLFNTPECAIGQYEFIPYLTGSVPFS